MKTRTEIALWVIAAIIVVWISAFDVATGKHHAYITFGVIASFGAAAIGRFLYFISQEL